MDVITTTHLKIIHLKITAPSPGNTELIHITPHNNDMVTIYTNAHNSQSPEQCQMHFRHAITTAFTHHEPLTLTHWGRDKMDAISQTTYSNAFSWMKIGVFWWKFHWNLFPMQGPINHIPALVQIMAWRLRGDKPLSEPMLVSLLTHIYVTWPQWVNSWIVERSREILSAISKKRSIRWVFQIIDT